MKSHIRRFWAAGVACLLVVSLSLPVAAAPLHSRYGDFTFNISQRVKELVKKFQRHLRVKPNEDLPVPPKP